ncbi:hypothetical protein ACHAXT_013099 [Thalassiosira profunda]
MDDFDDAFLDDAPADDGGGSRDNGGAGKGQIAGGDDAISVGSSSSSGSEGSASSSDSDGSSVTVPLAAATSKAARATKAVRKKPSKSAYFHSDSDSSDEESIDCLGSSLPEKRKGAASNDIHAESDGEGAGNVEGAAEGGNDKRQSKSSASNDKGDPLDADLDDDDEDGLVDFFSKPHDSSLATNTMAGASKEREQAKNAGRDEEGARAGKAGESLSPFDRLDSLDDDALADLDEESVGGGNAGNSARKEATSEVEMTAQRDFTITYNGEKRESPVPEEVVDSSDEDVEDEKERGRATAKENSSPNKSKAGVGWQTDGSETGGTSGDEPFDLFEKQSSPMRAPGSPTSLDTPCEDAGGSAEAATGDGAEATSAPSRVANPYRNPYQKQKKKSDDPQQRKSEAPHQKETANQRDLSRDAIEDAAPKAASPNKDPAASLVAVPLLAIDIGLAPTAGQTELQRLGIRQDQYKPPPHTPGPDPIVHKLDSRSRPKHARRNVAVDQVFSPPVSNMWKSKFAQFNHVQSEVAGALANSDDNVIVSAPTGAGKTALFEMAMARMFSCDLSARGGVGCVSKARKAVYVAPNKALCEERQADWAKRLGDVDPGIVCTTITGDVNATSCHAEIAGAHLILTTPEKFDSITRRWSDQFVLLSCIKLVLVDEVHMIGEADRGGTIESVIARMKTIQRAARARLLTASEIATSSYTNTTPEALVSNMRIVAVSATLPNLGQLASFVESGEAYTFDQSYRPVPLKTYVRACGRIGNNRYLFDKSLNQHVPEILRQFSNGRPAIVFCHSKKETEQLAEELAVKYANPSRTIDQPLLEYANKTDLAALQRCLRKGVAFHNAGLEASDRRLVEEAFGSGRISCLCATSTLAMGVNLPSHLVVIKGTSAYRGAELGHQDIDAGALMQMMGRAGRPGFDESGTAVIMTDSLSQRRYENVSQGYVQFLLAVLLHCRQFQLIDTSIFNPPGVITSVDEAVDWVKGSFLYRRIESHPLHYGLRERGDVHSFVYEKCADSIDKLRKIRAIEVDEDGTFAPIAGCHVMSRNFVSFDSMKAIVKMPHDSGPVQLLHMMSNCEKIQTQVRRNEKKSLNAAYKLVKYKLEGPQSKIRIQTPAEKAFVMLQASIGQHFFQDFALRQQMSNMIDSASQILSAVEQYAKEGSGHGMVATQGLLFRRSLHSSLWGENDGVLNQIGGVTQEMAAQLKASGISTFADAANSSDEDIAIAGNVTPSFANSLRAACSKILRRTLKLSAVAKEGESGRLELHVALAPRVGARSDDSSSDRVVSYSLLIFTDRAGGLLHYSEDITKGCEMRVQCPEKFGRAYIRLVGNLVGIDEQVTVDGNDRIQKSSFSLSPHVAKSSATKGKKQSKLNLTQPPATSRKRTIDAHRDSVTNVSDLRLHKRGKAPKGRGDDDDDCVIVDTEAVEFEVSSNEPPKTAAQKSGRKKSVTPSPHPRSNLTPVRNTASTAAPRSEKTARSNAYSSAGRRNNHSSWSKTTATSRKGPRNARSSSWFQEKKQQTGAQKTAFHSPKENPFASYQFDPNNIENSLDSNAHKSQIIPDNVSNAAFTTKNNRYGSFKTPANRRKGGASSSRISSVGLLQQKAAEMQEHHTYATSARGSYSNRGSIQNRTFDAPSVRHNFPASNGHMMGQFGQTFQESSQFTGLDQMSQGNHFQRPGTAAGSVMMQQQSYGMAAGPPSISPPPPFLARSHQMMTQNPSHVMQGPMAGMSRPMSSAGRSIVSHLRGNSYNQPSYGGMPQQQHFASHLPQQNAFQNHQMQQDFHLLGQDFDSSFHAGNQGMMTQQQQHEQLPSHFQPQSQYENTLHDPMCQYGLDPIIDHAGGRQFESAQQFGGGMDASAQMHQQYEAQTQMHSQYQAQPQVGVGHQFGGGGNATVRNPYQTQQVQQPPRNPYQRPQQAQQPQEQQEFQPPLQEVVVNNGSQSNAPSGLGGEEASQFDDAFL